MTSDDYLERGSGRPPLIGRLASYTPPRPLTWRETVDRELKDIITRRRNGMIQRRVRASYWRLPPCRTCGKVTNHRRRFRAWCSDRCENSERDVLAIRRAHRAKPEPPSPFTDAERVALRERAQARHLARLAILQGAHDGSP